jgi:hypothetical protein
VIRRLAAAILAVAVLAGTGACGSDDGSEGSSVPRDEGGAGPRSTSGGEALGPADEGIDGVESYRVDSNAHTEEDLTYELTPPVGGDHYPVPGTCGYYESDAPPDELVVHDLEHGAIWIAHDPDLDATQLTVLSELVAQEAKVIVTPYDGLAAPLVVSAWARQLSLDSVDDPRLQQFIATYRNSENAPEPSAACQGVGEPSVASPTA